MRSIIIAFFVVISVSCYCQNALPLFGNVSKEDVEMKECPFDKSASAMKLIDELTYVIEASETGELELISERRVRIKIFSSQGYEYASVRLPLYNSVDVDLSTIVANSYKMGPNNSVITSTINKKDLFNTKIINNVKGISFAFPNLQPGMVIEYTYRKKEKRYFSIDTWIFQNVIPIRTSLCRIIAPSYFNVGYILRTSKPISIQIDSSNTNNTESVFQMTEIRPFEPEQFSTALIDNIEHIDFTITRKIRVGINKYYALKTETWVQINNQLYKSSFFGLQLTKEIAGTTAFLDSVKKLSSTDEKINAIYNFVKQNITWNKRQTFYANNLNYCWKDKEGNSADINLLIMNFLTRVGIICSPLFVSTRENGKINVDFPSLSQFNGLDVLAFDSTNYYVFDATEKNCSYKIPPYNVINTVGFLINADSGHWVKVIDDRPLLKIGVTVSGSIDSNAVLTGNANIVFDDLAKVREQLQATNTKTDILFDHSNSIFSIILDKNTVKVDSTETEKPINNESPLTKKFQFKHELSNTENFYFFDPSLFSFLLPKIFSTTDRYADIDFICNQLQSVNMFLTIPSNLQLAEKPKNIIIRMSDSSMTFRRYITKNAENLIVQNIFEINRASYSTQEYKEVKEFFDKIYALIHEQIPFKKS